MSRKIILKFISIFFVSIQTLNPVFSQQTKTLTLIEAIDLSLKNSKQLKAGSARIDQAVAAVIDAENNRLPGFTVSGSYLRLLSPNVNLKIKSNNNNGGTGGTTGSTPKVSQALYGIANASYPLYTGGRIRYGIESAKYLEEAAKLDVDNNKNAVVLNTMNAYTNLYKANAAIAVIKQNLESSRQRDTSFSHLEQNGLLARNDLLKTELQTSNIELNLLDAENNRSLAAINMDLILGLPENTEIIIDPNSFKTVSTTTAMLDYEQLALQNRKDMQAVAYRKKAAETGIKSARSLAYPNIVLTGGYVAADVPNLVTITNAINAGIGVQYNLSSLWKKNSQLMLAKARVAEFEANQEELYDAVRLEISEGYQNYQLTLKKTEVYQKTLTQSEENYRITKNKYDNSLVTINDLLDADVALLQARLNVAAAQADAILAYNKLLQTTGTLSSTYNK